MSRKLALILFLTGLMLIISACNGTSNNAVPTQTMLVESPTTVSVTPTLTAAEETPEVQPAGTPRPFSPAPGGTLIIDNNDFFAAAGICVICHQNNVDQANNDVSNGEYWRSTMMANAAKDPYYLAGVSINVARYPEYSAAIETKCSTCHMPMAHWRPRRKQRHRRTEHHLRRKRLSRPPASTPHIGFRWRLLHHLSSDPK